MAVHSDFADFCRDLLGSVGPLRARRMFGGWGLSLDGLTIAIVADLGGGDKLWLKADGDTRTRFDAAGCERFSYGMRQRGTLVQRSMNYYCPPDDAMDSPDAMAPWARLALEAALKAHAAAVAKAPPGVAKERAARAARKPAIRPKIPQRVTPARRSRNGAGS